MSEQKEIDPGSFERRLRVAIKNYLNNQFKESRKRFGEATALPASMTLPLSEMANSGERRKSIPVGIEA
jgi:hypothetical protein